MSGATLNPAHSFVKVAGGILWFVGLILLLVFPPVGFLLLIVALILSILSLGWTRQARHDEQMEAQATTASAVAAAAVPQQPPLPPPAPDAIASAQERLQGLQQLHNDGLITDDEYEQKRKNIVDEM